MSDQPESTMLPRTPLAVTETHHYKYGQFTVWLKVYFQDSQGRIRTVNGNAGGTSAVAVDNANLGKEFAAISWGAPESVIRPEERLYYTNSNGQIFEHCWNWTQGWYPGELNGQFWAARHSALAAGSYAFFSNKHHILLYYQDPNTDEICELIKNGDNPWMQGTKRPVAMRGTSIAVACASEGTQIWYQQPDTKFVQYGFESGKDWKKGNFNSNLEYEPGASVSTVGPLRVFTVTRSNKLALTLYDPVTGQWGPSKELIDQIPLASVAAIKHPVHWADNFNSTVYCQKSEGEITCIKFDWKETQEVAALSVKL